MHFSKTLFEKYLIIILLFILIIPLNTLAYTYGPNNWSIKVDPNEANSTIVINGVTYTIKTNSLGKSIFIPLKTAAESDSFIASPIGTTVAEVGGGNSCNATGGAITDSGGYRIHTFTSDGTFTAGANCNAEILVVAGGGGGSNNEGSNRGGGGGGGGGVIYKNSYAVSTGATTVTVGGGGAVRTNGGNSVFGALTAVGGGAGAYHGDGLAGGSGGGAGQYCAAYSGGAGTAGQGNSGGSLPCNNCCYNGGPGAGGGGAGGAGSEGSSGDNLSGGGPGVAYSISGTSATYAAGGGAGVYASPGMPSYSGVANTGNGGSGSRETTAGTGGSGIVIVRYPLSGGGSTTINPVSCMSIKKGNAAAADGVYTIDPDGDAGNAAFSVYCDMTYDGGGWTMMMKATRGTTFNYNSSYWTTSNTLNESATNINDGDAKFRSFNEYPVKDLAARWPDIASNRYWLQNSINGGTAVVLPTFFSSGNLKFFGDAKTYSGFTAGSFSSQADIRFYGFNFVNNRNYGLIADVRWGFGWNENGEGLYSSPATLNTGAAPGSDDVSGGIGMSTSFGSYSAGDYIACCQDSTGMNRSARVEIYGRNTDDESWVAGGSSKIRVLAVYPCGCTIDTITNNDGQSNFTTTCMSSTNFNSQAYGSATSLLNNYDVVTTDGIDGGFNFSAAAQNDLVTYVNGGGGLVLTHDSFYQSQNPPLLVLEGLSMVGACCPANGVSKMNDGAITNAPYVLPSSLASIQSTHTSGEGLAGGIEWYGGGGSTDHYLSSNSYGDGRAAFIQYGHSAYTYQTCALASGAPAAGSDESKAIVNALTWAANTNSTSNFDSGSTEWTTGRGTWNVGAYAGHSKAYIQSATLGNPMESITGSALSSYIVETDIYTPSGSVYSHPGIIFHALDTSNYNVVYLRPHSSNTTSAVQCGYVSGGGLTGTTGGTATIPWDTWYNVRLVVNNSGAAVYVNGVYITTCANSRGYSSGKAGLWEHDAAAGFDNFTVTPTTSGVTNYTLTYTAGANCTITGTNPQTVAAGANGSTVTVVPGSGYAFSNWSDSSTANPRTDTNINANLSVSAVCLPPATLYCDEDGDGYYSEFVAYSCPSGRQQTTVGSDSNDNCYNTTNFTSRPNGSDEDCDGINDEDVMFPMYGLRKADCCNGCQNTQDAFCAVPNCGNQYTNYYGTAIVSGSIVTNRTCLCATGDCYVHSYR